MTAAMRNAFYAAWNVLRMLHQKHDDASAAVAAYSVWIAQRREYRALLHSKREAF
jgi:hypothetical protein